jgi:hypothetical protein
MFFKNIILLSLLLLGAIVSSGKIPTEKTVLNVESVVSRKMNTSKQYA